LNENVDHEGICTTLGVIGISNSADTPEGFRLLWWRHVDRGAEAAYLGRVVAADKEAASIGRWRNSESTRRGAFG